jgi:ferredoxin
MKSSKRVLSLPRAVRILVAALVLLAAMYGFVFSGAAAELIVRAIASWQLFPLSWRVARAALEGFSGLMAAVIVRSLSIAALIITLSSLFGRWYCAALCPLGAIQDLASFLGRRKRRYRKPANAMRAIAFIVITSLALAGAMSLASFLDPWSIFSRFMADDVQPLARAITRADNPGLSFLSAAIPAAVMAALIAMAVLRGRWFCGLLCPVGSALGLLNRIAPFRVRLEEEACISCGACSLRCPASCIDVKAKRLDATRCVGCLACVDACPTKAIRYGRAVKAVTAPENPISRKRFLFSLGSGAATLALAALPGKAFASRALPARSATVPPGAVSRKRFLETCTACGLCISVCPSRVLQPSLGQLGARGFFVPRLDYSVSYCQFECVSCLRACPSGALREMILERKKLCKIGDSTLVKERCIVIVKHTKCGACAEHCPTGAVRMVVGSTGLPEPVFSSDICIGCGACHHACPAQPEKAITVAGLAVHQTAKKPALDLFGATPESGTPNGDAGKNSGAGDFPF